MCFNKLYDKGPEMWDLSFFKEEVNLYWLMFIVGDFRPVVETTVQSTLSSTPDSTTVSYQGIAYD